MTMRSLRTSSLPLAEREAFAADLLRQQLEDLNGLGDQLRYLVDDGADESAIRAIVERCVNIIEALRWNRAEAVRMTWRWLEAPPAYAEDAFAPTLLLAALVPDEPRVWQWHDALGDEARAHVDRLMSFFENGLP